MEGGATEEHRSPNRISPHGRELRRCSHEQRPGTGLHNVSRTGAAKAASARPDAEALSLFFRSLAVMVASGVGLDRSLDHLSLQSDQASMGPVCAELARRVSTGTPLSNAFAAHSKVFTQLQIRMLAVGERTGNLDLVLARLATYEEKRRGTTMKVKSALTYPLFLVVLATFMLIVLPPYMFGGLFQMIASSGVEPPLITRVVMALSHFIRSPFFWILTFVGLVAASKLGPPLWANPSVRRETFERLGGAPVVGPFLQVLATARFARALELQLQVGENPLVGLAMACEASGNPVLAGNADEIVAALKGGETLVDSLKGCGFFPRTFLDLVRAGEESAQLPDMLGRSADMYEIDLDQAIDRFTALLEPMIMLVMGSIVGVVVIATMLPMMTLIQNL